MPEPSWMRKLPNCCEACVNWHRKPEDKWMSDADRYVGTCTSHDTLISGEQTDSRYRCPSFQRRAGV